jgi:hypothetical protein
MDPELLVDIRTGLHVAKVAIEKQEKAIDSNSESIAEITKAIANYDLRLRNIEAMNLGELVFMVKSMKDSLDNANRKIETRTSTLMVGAILALITSVINLASNNLINGLFNHSNNAGNIPAQTKNK